MKKRIVIALSIITLMAVTAYGTYRITIDNLQVSAEPNCKTIYVTVFGQTDAYDEN